MCYSRGMLLSAEKDSFLKRRFSFASGILTANSPQLFLFFCCLAYNNLFTRLQMAREASTYLEREALDPI